MKIEITLSSDELVCINNQLQKAYGRTFQQVALYNVVHSIVLELADSFDTKTKTRIKKANIFDSRKKTKITLKYHEAWALKIYLHSEVPTIDNEYQRSLLNKQIANLDQKLT